ncbi:MAG: YlxR family protein [Clostridia bacterium]|nr:YlxR family protein [Clostridia bacterium]
MKDKKIPQRMCIGCRKMFDKRDLIRVVRSSDGKVTVDITGKQNGRGAYICKEKACFERIKKTGALNRALDTTVDSAVYDEIEKGLNTFEG